MILALLLPSLQKIGILLDFRINQDFIAEFLCVNKEEPITMCSGKCYLADQLKKADEQEQKQGPHNPKDRLEVIHYHYDLAADLSLFAAAQQTKLQAIGQASHYSSSFISKIFRPPELI